MEKIFQRSLSLFLLLHFVNGTAFGKESAEVKAARIHKAVLTIDTHSDTPLNLLRDGFDIGKKQDQATSGTKVDFPRMKEGGLDAQFFAVFVGQGPRTSDGNAIVQKKALDILAAIRKSVGANPDQAEIALTPDDAYRLKGLDKRAIFMGIENGYALGNDITLVKKYYDMGIRYITLCHTSNNDICDSSTDKKKGAEHHGLSLFGKEVLAEMNRTGMIVDVSHSSDETFMDVIRLSTAPVIASHSCSRAVCDHPRNLTDDDLRALAKNGGVIQMCFLSDYVKKPDPNPKRDSVMAIVSKKYNDFQGLSDEQSKEAYKEYREAGRKFPNKLATVQDMVNHIDHIVKVIGIDYIGIGTDFDGGGELSGCRDVSMMGNVTMELVKRGYSDEDIRKIWGGNFMRVFRSVQKSAKL
ncbi:MAG: dipeptidase [Prolixibacteraceae bacterium]|jgi:membrane dipeptidase|nr:dipeptidase [Prolixibacteraceae bacterium]